MAGPIPLLGLLDELRDFANRRNMAKKLVGGGIRGAGTRALLDLDLPEDATKAERAVYENTRRAAAPVMGLAAAPAAIKTAGRALKDAPRTQALETARQNAVKMLGLPENNTAMDRARALGFVDAYHGTADDIAKIDPAKFGSSTGAQSAKKAFWAVDDPVTARGYAEYAAKDAKVKQLIDAAKKAEARGNWDLYDDLIAKAEDLEARFVREPLQGQNVMPLMIRTNRGVSGAEMDAKGAEFVDLEGGVNRFLAQAIRDKRDVGVIKNLADDVGLSGRPATHFAAMNPAVIRSRFAAFDPARTNENDLLASLAAMGISIPMILGLLDEERVD